MAGRFLGEPRLLALAYDLEKELGTLAQSPKFLGSAPGPFADAGMLRGVVVIRRRGR